MVDDYTLVDICADSFVRGFGYFEFKAMLLLLVLLLFVGGAVFYFSYARGVFECMQQLVLVVDDSEGVSVGMDMIFVGFLIGRVCCIELVDDGNACIFVDVLVKDVHWLCQFSVFILQRGVVGNISIKVFIGVLIDAALFDGAVCIVLCGDVIVEISCLMVEVRQLLQNFNIMSVSELLFNVSLVNVQSFIDKFKGLGGVMGALVGSDVDVKKLIIVLDCINTLLVRFDGLAVKVDMQVFGNEGLVCDACIIVLQFNAMLIDVRVSLVKVDDVLKEVKVVGENARVVIIDLGALRVDVEISLRNVDGLINELNCKWLFKCEMELKLL